MTAQKVRGLLCKQLLLAACLLDLWTPLIQADRIKIVFIPETPTEGQDLTFSVENVQGDIHEFVWFRGMASQNSTKIFKYLPGQYNPQHNGVQYTNRESGFPNGSLRITGIRPSDVGQYNTIIQLRPKEVLKASIDLRLTAPTEATPTTEAPPMKELPRMSSMLGWIVAGVVVGVLLCGAIGAILVYRFVLWKKEADTGVAGTLDPRRKKPPARRHDETASFYEVVDSSLVESRKNSLPISGPLPPLPGTCPKPDSNYMDLLYKTESVYTEIKR